MAVVRRARLGPFGFVLRQLPRLGEIDEAVFLVAARQQDQVLDITRLLRELHILTERAAGSGVQGVHAPQAGARDRRRDRQHASQHERQARADLQVHQCLHFMSFS